MTVLSTAHALMHVTGTHYSKSCGVNNASLKYIDK